MEKPGIREKLIEVLNDIQLQGGYAQPDITDQTRPLVDLEGFDSQLAVEVTSELSRLLGIIIPAGENIFKAKGIARALTLNEIVDVLARFAAAGSKAEGGKERSPAVGATLSAPAK